MEKRRRFLGGLGAATAGMLVGSTASARQPAGPMAATGSLPEYARRHDYKTLRQSSYDRTGGNRDSVTVAPGQTAEVLKSDGPGVVTHVWFTIASPAEHHLKELVFRIYWDGQDKPSVETPIGDFFGLNLGEEYYLYQSAFLNCSSVKALNSYFAMPFKRSARATVTNEGTKQVNALYSNIDYQIVPSLPEDALYFHAQYRQSIPEQAESYPGGTPELNVNGKGNYVFCGHGHWPFDTALTQAFMQSRDGWFGEGDDMTFIDGETKPSINGTGTEDYFCGAWDFGGRDNGKPFANLYNGAPYMLAPEITNGHYCLYRWHADNPIAFTQSLNTPSSMVMQTIAVIFLFRRLLVPDRAFFRFSALAAHRRSPH